MGRHGTGIVMEHCFEIIKMFHSRKHITVKDVQSELGVVYSTAHKYLTAAVCAMPIQCVNEFDREYHEPLKYQLMGKYGKTMR